MFEKVITIAFFGATFGAIALAAGLGAQNLEAGLAAHQAASAPVVILETVVIAGQRTKAATQVATEVTAQAPEQVALVR
jgi:hypothetical protein